MLLSPIEDILTPARDILPPSGWANLPLWDPFEAFLGPMLYRREADGAIRFALQVDDRHCDGQGVAAPGLLMTYADATIGWAVWRSAKPNPGVTISQHSDFIGAVRLGDRVECIPVIERQSASVVFARGVFKVGNEVVFSASSLWKLMAPK